MKRSTLILSLFMALTCVGKHAAVQQAKAFEVVRYKANINKKVFRLDYADGYVGASRITLMDGREKKQVFTPESGVPEANGDLVFHPKKTIDKMAIKLRNINEEIEAPGLIQATYLVENQIFKMVFKKLKN